MLVPINRIRVLTILLLFMGSVMYGHAQKSLYFKLGENFNNQLEDKFSTHGLEPGGFLTCGLSNNFGKWLGSGIEVSFIQKSAEWSFDSTTVNDVNQFIDIAFTLSARKEFKSSVISLTGGMMLSFWQAGQRYISSGEYESSGKLSYPDARSTMDIGMYLGIEYSWKKVFLELRTQQGLIDISNDKYDLGPIYNQGISIGLGYRLGIE